MPTVTSAVDPNLREVIINGPSEDGKIFVAKISCVWLAQRTRKSGPPQRQSISRQDRGVCKLRGSLTVVNVVPLEDYLLGVVPSELGLPQLEAQKAQAVAARTYAVANIGGYRQTGI